MDLMLLISPTAKHKGCNCTLKGEKKYMKISFSLNISLQFKIEKVHLPRNSKECVVAYQTRNNTNN